MECNTPFPSPSSYITPVIFVLVRSICGLGPQWLSFVRNFTNARLNHLGEGNHTRRQTHIQFVTYCYDSLVSVVPSHVVGGHDEVEEIPIDHDGTITLDMIALFGYESIIKMAEDFQKRPKQDPNERFSYHLWHIAAAGYPHFDVSPTSWDLEWTPVHGGLTRLNIDLSMILINSCPKLLQSFFVEIVTGMCSTYIPPWFRHCQDCPHHTIVLPSFVPPSEPGGVIPFTVAAGHPIISSSVPSAIVGVTVLHSLPISAAHGTQYMTDDPWLGLPNFQGSGSYMQVPATAPVLNQYEGPQSSSPTAVQTQPHSNSIDIHVPGAQGLASMPWSVSPHGSGVGRQESMPHDHMGAFNVSGNLADTNAGNTMLWTGTLYLNGVCAQARAPATEAVRNPMLLAWPKTLHLEFVAAPNVSTLDIQAWMHDTKAAVVRIRGTDCNFDPLVGELRNNGGYAIVKWENQGVILDRLLLVPFGNILLCAAFPDKGFSESDRPKPQTRRPIRILPPSQKRKKKSSAGPQPDSVATATPPDEPYVETAQSTITPTQPQPEEPEVAYCPQNADAIGSSADSSLGGILIPKSEAMEDWDKYESVDSDGEST